MVKPLIDSKALNAMPARGLLQGAKAIMDAYELNDDQFNRFVMLGLPLRKVQGRIVAHVANIDAFFVSLTNPRLSPKVPKEIWIKDGKADLEISDF